MHISKWKKAGILVLAMALSLSALAGCTGSGGGTSSAAAADPPAAEGSAVSEASTEEAAGESAGATQFDGAELQFMIDKDAVMDGHNAVFAAIEEKFGIKTAIEVRMGGGEGDNIIKTRLASGDIPDVFVYNTGALLQAISPADYLLDLTDYEWTKNFEETYVDAASVDGRLYGVPTGFSEMGGILYNKKTYEELGLQLPKTWEEFKANCQAAKDAGKVGVIGAYKDDWTTQLIFLGDEYNVVSGDPSFPAEYTANNAKYATHEFALRSWQKLSEGAAFLNEDAMATTHDVAIQMLATGDGIHYPMLSGHLSTVQQNYPDAINDIGVMGIPGDNADDMGATMWMPGGFYANKNPANLDMVLTWLEFYTTQECWDIYAEKIKPPGPYVIKGLQLPDDVFPGVKDIQAYFDAGKTALALEFASPVKGASAPQICQAVGSGLTTAEDGAKQYDADVEKQAIQLNLPGW